MPSRLTSNHLVGRVGELAELELAVREASDGRPTLVLLGGDSGVGKTRLVGELEQRLSAGSDNAPLILRGDGVEQADGELPYAPIMAALRSHLAMATLGACAGSSSYFLILWVWSRAPIAIGSALRDTSVVFAALIAARLGEGLSPQRLGAIALVTAGACLIRFA